MLDIAIRRPSLGPLIGRESLIRRSARAFIRERINTLGEPVDDIKSNALSECARQSRYHRVIVSVHVRYQEEDRIEARIERLHQSQIGNANEFVTAASL